MSNLESPTHKSIRSVLRIVGPMILLIGIGFIAVGMISFFSAMGNFQGPRYFWCCFVGMPLVFVGSVMCMAGFMGAFSRYVMTEQAPVARDTVNYMAEGTQDAVRKVARSAAEGIREGLAPKPAASQSAKTSDEPQI
jgi:hypothetical protein